MAKLIINLNELPAFTVELKPGVNYLGRNWVNHIQIDHPTISERHCEFMVEKGVIHVRDLSSTNGTFINHQPIKEAILGLGQLLQVGAANIIVAIPQAPAAAKVAIPPLPAPESIDPHFFADGAPACSNHHDQFAGWECSHCGRFYCDACVHRIQRVGGKALHLCPSCSNRCEAYVHGPVAQEEKRSVFNFIFRWFSGHRPRPRD